MAALQIRVPHNRTLDEARGRLELAVTEAKSQFGALVREVAWSDDRNAVTMRGPGFVVAMSLDPEALKAECDFPILGRLLGRSVMDGLATILQKRLS